MTVLVNSFRNNNLSDALKSASNVTMKLHCLISYLDRLLESHSQAYILCSYLRSAKTDEIMNAIDLIRASTAWGLLCKRPPQD